jgi:N-acetylmuramic acid 6-phosphate etherase
MVDVRPTNAKLRERAARMVAELTDLTPAAAQQLLERAGGEVKVALAMHFTGLPAKEARRCLKDATLRALDGRGGKPRRALTSPGRR